MIATATTIWHTYLGDCQLAEIGRGDHFSNKMNGYKRFVMAVSDNDPSFAAACVHNHQTWVECEDSRKSLATRDIPSLRTICNSTLHLGSPPGNARKVIPASEFQDHGNYFPGVASAAQILRILTS
jgi:hypothetical protein